MRKLLYILLLVSSTMLGQDMHYSQFHNNPVAINPAYAGFIEGDTRIVLNHRSQWARSGTPFITSTASGDLPLGKGYMGGSWFGIGYLFNQDRAGSVGLQRTMGRVSVSHMNDLDHDHMIGIGANVDMVQYRLQSENIVFDNQFTGIDFDQTATSGEDLSIYRQLYFSAGAGLFYVWRPSEHTFTQTGVSVNNINRPMLGIYTEDPIPMTYTLNQNTFVRIPNNDLIESHLIYQYRSEAQELVYGLMYGKYTKYSNKIVTVAYFGLFHRHQDAIILYGAYDFDGVRVGLSYDINYSAFHLANGFRGGPELSFYWESPLISRRGKKQSLLCPMF